jgi:hypothetical protein
VNVRVIVMCVRPDFFHKTRQRLLAQRTLSPYAAQCIIMAWRLVRFLLLLLLLLAVPQQGRGAAGSSRESAEHRQRQADAAASDDLGQLTTGPAGDAATRSTFDIIVPLTGAVRACSRFISIATAVCSGSAQDDHVTCLPGTARIIAEIPLGVLVGQNLQIVGFSRNAHGELPWVGRKAGLVEGDRIVAVDGRSAAGLSPRKSPLALYTRVFVRMCTAL